MKLQPTSQPDGPNEPFDERMRPRNPGHRLHCFHVQNPQIGLPAVELEQRIMIGNEPPWQAFSGIGLVEHATESHSIYGDRLHTKADDAAAKLIHHDQDPVRLEQDRISPEQVQAPESVLGVTEATSLWPPKLRIRYVHGPPRHGPSR
jgi:hypothetical protein